MNSFRNGDGTQGKLTSPEFSVTRPWLSFLIGGGAIPAKTCVNLLIDGQVVRTATGHENEALGWVSWSLQEWQGKRARIEIVDAATSGWGHVNADHFVLGDAPSQAAQEAALWLDYGPDFYAGVTWSGGPPGDDRRILLGWMSNWQYAQNVPTHPWRSAMSLPRSLALRKTSEGFRLIQQPVQEIEKTRDGTELSFAGGTLNEAAAWLSQQKHLPALMDVEMEFGGAAVGSPFTVHFQSGPEEALAVTCDPQRQTLSMDRTHSGHTDFHPAFPAIHEAPLRITNGTVTLRLVLDAASLEVFAQGGELAMTQIFFPKGSQRALSLTCEGSKPPSLKSLRIHGLKR